MNEVHSNLFVKNFIVGLSALEYKQYIISHSDIIKLNYIDYETFFSQNKFRLLRCNNSIEPNLSIPEPISLFFNESLLNIKFINDLKQELINYKCQDLLNYKDSKINVLLNNLNDHIVKIKFTPSQSYYEYTLIQILNILSLIIENNYPISDLMKFNYLDNYCVHVKEN
ncbi:hypothetical protein [Acinetobacter sp. Marseille-Q1618]|uniref:hypothetical protein n=1 Tax=Acinetobacter sp. Marseille-Q1618 TaxID=2697502 RepID=UPI00156D4560|nr:hypothetical protein [Acinetobacter sp. Marseille-Q1618]